MEGEPIMEWKRIKSTFDTEAKAQRTARIVATTETKLANQPNGPLIEVETSVRKIEGKWQVYWRKVFMGYRTSCSRGCSTCPQIKPKPTMAKVLPFRKPSL